MKKICFVFLLLAVVAKGHCQVADTVSDVAKEAVDSVVEAMPTVSGSKTTADTIVWTYKHYYKQALWRYQRGRNEAALSDINRAITLKHNDIESYKLKCYILANLKQMKEVVETASTAMTYCSNCPELYHLRACAYYFNFEPDKALRDYQTLLMMDNTKAMYYNNYISQLNEMRKDEDMVKLYDQFDSQLQLHRIQEPDSCIAEVMFFAASAYYRLGNKAEALKTLDAAIARNDTMARFYNDRGVIYTDFKKYDKALIDLNKAVRYAKKENADYYFNRGVVLSHLQRYEEAKDDYLRAVSMGSSGWGIYNNLANAFQALHNYRMAGVYYKNMIDLDANDGMAYENYAFCLIEEDNIYEATKMLHKAEKLQPKEVDILLGLAACYFVQGNTEKSKYYQTKIDVETNYLGRKNLVNKLMKDGYVYSKKFQDLWKSMF